MANVRSGNSHYVDSTGQLRDDACRISKIICTATGGAGALELRDGADSVKKIDIRVDTASKTQMLDFGVDPMFCPTGLYVHTLTNCIACILYTHGDPNHAV